MEIKTTTAKTDGFKVTPRMAQSYRNRFGKLPYTSTGFKGKERS